MRYFFRWLFAGKCNCCGARCWNVKSQLLTTPCEGLVVMLNPDQKHAAHADHACWAHSLP